MVVTGFEVKFKQIFILVKHKGGYPQILIFKGQQVEKLVKIPQVQSAFLQHWIQQREGYKHAAAHSP